MKENNMTTTTTHGGYSLFTHNALLSLRFSMRHCSWRCHHPLDVNIMYTKSRLKAQFKLFISATQIRLNSKYFPDLTSSLFCLDNLTPTHHFSHNVYVSAANITTSSVLLLSSIFSSPVIKERYIVLSTRTILLTTIKIGCHKY